MQYSKEIGALAAQALLFEVSATPKPGLVDRNNSGAHRDMDFFTFMSSVSVLAPHLERLAAHGGETARKEPRAAFRSARQLGVAAERDMFAATGGVNTHKGSIFSIGLVCVAAGRLAAEGKSLQPEAVCRTVAAMTAGLVGAELREDALKNAEKLTYGERLYLSYGIIGSRGEAESGFSSVLNISYPKYTACLAAGMSINDALVHTLVRLMGSVCDTNIIARHDPQTALWAREQAKLLDGAGLPEIADFDRLLIEKNISPGGCADLLSVTCLLHKLKDLKINK